MTSATTSQPSPDDAREGGLLAWQWRGYPSFHADRRNLAIHIVTVPLFWMGLLSVGATVILGWRFAFGALGILVALIAQGRGHKREPNAPLPFRGPSDVLARFVCEQLVTFPRFVLRGGWSSAWRAGQRKA